MTVYAYDRGHLCEYMESGGKWIYSDTKMPVGYEIRPCKKCNRMPTPEGYDACLGYIPDVTSACCGHGITKGFIL